MNYEKFIDCYSLETIKGLDILQDIKHEYNLLTALVDVHPKFKINITRKKNEERRRREEKISP